MKKKIQHVFNESGFTLMEIIVAIAIMMLISELVILSISVAFRMNQRADRLRKAANEMGRKILSESGTEEGEIILEFGGYRIDSKGYLYTKDAGNGLSIQVIWADQRAGEKIATDSNVDFESMKERRRE